MVRGRPTKNKEIVNYDEELKPRNILIPEVDDIDRYDVNFIGADAYGEEHKNRVKRILSGTPLDDILEIGGGGFESSSIYMLYGRNRSGKTQTCFTMAVLNEWDVIWVDAGEETFKTERITQIAESRGLDSKTILGKIHYVRAFNATHLEAIISRLANEFMKIEKDKNDANPRRVFITSKLKTERVGLIVLDSLAPLFRLQFQTMDALAPRQRAILRVIHYLKRISEWFNCVVLVTNQEIASPAPFGVMYVPVGGPTVTHNFDVQVQMRRGQKGAIIATLEDSSSTPIREVALKITTRGVEPYFEEKPKSTEKGTEEEETKKD